MDDKFNQWCIDNFNRESENMTANDRMILLSAYKIEILDEEISELKKKIAELEGKK